MSTTTESTESPPSDSLSPFSLTPAEWLVVFPHAPAKASSKFRGTLAPPAGDLENGTTSAAADPAEELRQKLPVDQNAVDHAFKVLGAPGLAFQNRVSNWTLPWADLRSPIWFIMPAILSLSAIVLTGSIWALNDGMFGTRQLIAGVFAMSVFGCSIAFSGLSQVLVGGPLIPPGNAIVTASLHQLIRWQQLGTGELRHEANKPENSAESPFLQHDKDDSLCPCKLCLKNLPRIIFWESIIRSFSIGIWGFFSFFVMGWTPMIQYHSSFWSQPWGIFLGIILLGSTLFYMMISMPNKWWPASGPIVNMTTRIFFRASQLALSSFLERASMDLLRPPPITMDETEAKPELFSVLHAGYVTAWESSQLGKDHWALLTFTVMTAGGAVATIINMVSLFARFIVVEQLLYAHLSVPLSRLLVSASHSGASMPCVCALRSLAYL